MLFRSRGAYGGGEKFVMKAYLLISRLRIHNANAMSSTLTIGVPAMTAWLGAVHALERKLGERREPALEGIRLVKTAVSYHKTNLQIYKGLGDYVNSLVGTANPLNEKGERPSFIEDARTHLSVSLLIEVERVDGNNMELLEQAVKEILPQMKMAGGDILDIRKDRKSTRLNSSHNNQSRMPSSA